METSHQHSRPSSAPFAGSFPGSPRPKPPATNGSTKRRFRRPASFRLWLVFVVSVKVSSVFLFVRGHPLLAAAVFFSPAPWLAWQLIIPCSRGLGPSIRAFRTARREVWLTIDDGPDPATTPRVLDLLDEHRARATFFVIGKKAAHHPGLLREIVRRGHTLGNHTHTHPHASFWAAGAARTGEEIDRCERAIKNAGLPPPRWFRPPVGLKSLAIHPQLSARDLDLVLWSARGYDTQVSDPAVAVRRICQSIEPGAIILAHESGPAGSPRVEVVAQLLQQLSADGYRCVLPGADQLICD